MTRLPLLPRRDTAIRLLAAWLAAAVLALNLRPVLAQEAGPSLVITSVDSQNFPTVTAYLTVTGANGLPLVGLANSHFSLEEDGQPVNTAGVVLESDTSQQLSLVLGIDVSLNDTTLAQIKAAVQDFVNTLGPQDQVAVISFYDEVADVQAFTSDRALLADSVSRLTSGGSATAFNAAADRAISLLAALPAGRKAAIFFTNSGDTFNELDPQPILARAQEAGVRLYPMAFTTTANPDLMQDWARFSGGQAYLLTSAAEIAPNLQTLGVLLRQSYKLTFQSGLQADNARHDLAIALDYQEQAAQAAADFVATPGEVVVEGPGLGNGQTVRGNVFLVADVRAPAAIQSVTFFLDGEPLVVLTQPPYRFDWDTTTAGAGVHALAVEAVDTAGNVGQVQVSLNVVLPPPVIPTATPAPPQPTPVPVVPLLNQPVETVVSGALRIGRLVLIGGGLLLGLVVAAVVWVGQNGKQRRRQVRTCTLQLTNTGNMRSRFEVRAEDPSQALRFEFALNDAGLAQRKEKPAPAPAAAVPVQGANGAAVPAAEAAPAKGKGPAARLDNKQKAKLAMGQAQEKAGRVLDTSSSISDWFMNLAYFLPGKLGAGLRRTSSQMRNVQRDMYEAKEMPDRAGRWVSSVVPTKPVLSGPPMHKDAQIAAQKAAAASAAAPAATTLVAAPATTTAAGPVAASPAAPAAAAPRVISTKTVGWSLTPFVEPGETLSLQLHIRPGRALKTQDYAFRVLSRTAEEKEAAINTEHGSIAMTGVAWPVRLISGLLLLAVVVLAALLVWFLLTTFGVVGV